MVEVSKGSLESLYKKLAVKEKSHDDDFAYNNSLILPVFKATIDDIVYDDEDDGGDEPVTKEDYYEAEFTGNVCFEFKVDSMLESIRCGGPVLGINSLEDFLKYEDDYELIKADIYDFIDSEEEDSEPVYYDNKDDDYYESFTSNMEDTGEGLQTEEEGVELKQESWDRDLDLTYVVLYLGKTGKRKNSRKRRRLAA